MPIASPGSIGAEREFTFNTVDGVRLAGTLTVPGPGVWPAALILNGSGPLDRESAFKGQELGFAGGIASELATVGVASLRLDKRGVGASAGDYMSMGLATETDDAVAALGQLATAPEVDARRLALVGHSVGALIAARIAAMDRAVGGHGGDGGTVGAVVMLAGPAVDGERVLAWQAARIATSLPGPSWLLPRVAMANHNYGVRKVQRSRGATVRLPFKRQPARWMREFMAHDPEADLRRMQCPVLAITGRKDIQVDADDVARIGALVAGPFTGETPADLTHVLRTEPGPGGILTYQSQLKRPIDQALLLRIAAWVADGLGPA